MDKKYLKYKQKYINRIVGGAKEAEEAKKFTLENGSVLNYLNIVYLKGNNKKYMFAGIQTDYRVSYHDDNGMQEIIEDYTINFCDYKDSENLLGINEIKTNGRYYRKARPPFRDRPRIEGKWIVVNAISEVIRIMLLPSEDPTGGDFHDYFNGKESFQDVGGIFVDPKDVDWPKIGNRLGCFVTLMSA